MLRPLEPGRFRTQSSTSESRLDLIVPSASLGHPLIERKQDWKLKILLKWSLWSEIGHH